MSLREFLFSSPRFLTFGFLAAFLSSFGQTFFIALSSADIRAEFGLGHADFGLIYACGTIASAVLLIWAGRKIDDVDLRLYTFLVCAGLGCACLAMSGVGSAFWLIPVVFALRFTGQGLMSHVALVSMARYYDAHRGKALSVASMGFPAGEALFPTLAVAVIAVIGWRQMWLGAGTILLVIVIPLILWLLKGHAERHHRFAGQSDGVVGVTTGGGWTRARVIRDPAFYVVMPSYLAMPFISTGFFFHQIHLSESKGWDIALFASFFVIYAMAQTTSAMASGLLVDRIGALRLMRVYLMPALGGLLLLASFDAPWAGAVFMALMGLTSGAVSVAHGAIWAEIYGVAHLGAIKALGTALMVFSSALSPPVMGLVIDAGGDMNLIALCSALFIVGAAALIRFLYPHFTRPEQPATPEQSSR